MKTAFFHQADEDSVADIGWNAEESGCLRKGERCPRHLVELVPDAMDESPPGTGVSSLRGGRERRAQRLARNINDLRKAILD
jgi:hypothetical protein